MRFLINVGFILILLLVGLTFGQDLAINEFLANNDTTVADQDGEYDDWIELYNYGSTAINLGGFYLSDNQDNLVKWTFPDTSIAPDSFLVVWADEDLDQNGLHADFKLSASGEAIYLSDSNTQVVDYILFGNQFPDISTGRFPDGSGEFKFMYPTFNSPNNGDDPVLYEPGEGIFGECLVHSIDLHFYFDNWSDSLEHYFEDLDEEYLPVGITINDTITLDSVGVRYKGNSSYEQSGNSPKKPFKLKFDKFPGGQTLAGLSVINLHNCINDPSFMRETIAYHVARGIMPAPRTAYANLLVDGTLIGFYVLVEQVDETFLGMNFNSANGNLYKAGNDGANLEYKGENQQGYETDYELKTNESENDWSRFITMINRLNNTPDDEFAVTVNDYLELDNCIRLLAYNMVLSNFDSYTGSGRNYYMYDDLSSDRFKMIPWDLNESFGVYTNNWDIIEQDVIEISNLNIRPLNRRILENDSLQQMYLGYISEFISGPASYDSVTYVTDLLLPVISNHVQADNNKFYDYQDFIDNIENDVVLDLGHLIPGLKSFSQARNENLALQLTYVRVYPGDTNNNGIVEALDILPIAVYFLSAGYERSVVSFNWQGQRARPWDIPSATYSDANGDGLIDENDIIGIGVNWGNSHQGVTSSYVINRSDLEILEQYRENLEILYNSLKGNSEPVIEMKNLLESILQNKIAPVPNKISLKQNYPNPFNGETIISFTLDKRRSVSLKVYDIGGKIVALPLIEEVLDSGGHKIVFNTSGLSSGVYFYRLEIDKTVLTNKMTIIK